MSQHSAASNGDAGGPKPLQRLPALRPPGDGQGSGRGSPPTLPPLRRPGSSSSPPSNGPPKLPAFHRPAPPGGRSLIKNTAPDNAPAAATNGGASSSGRVPHPAFAAAPPPPEPSPPSPTTGAQGGGGGGESAAAPSGAAKGGPPAPPPFSRVKTRSVTSSLPHPAFGTAAPPPPPFTPANGAAGTPSPSPTGGAPKTASNFSYSGQIATRNSVGATSATSPDLDATKAKHKSVPHPAFAAAPPPKEPLPSPASSAAINYSSPSNTSSNSSNNNNNPSSGTPAYSPAGERKTPPAIPPMSVFRNSVRLSPQDVLGSSWEDEGEEIPYPFLEEDSDSNIVFTPETISAPRPCVKGGKLEKLVQRLTYEKYPDPDYLNAFLLTYRSFTTPTELLALLIARYDVPEPRGASDKEREEWMKNQQNPIRLRVFNVLKTWIGTHFYDFLEDRSLLDTLLDFIQNTMMTTGMEKAGDQLKRMTERKITGNETEVDVQFNKPPPKPILPASSPFSLMDLDPLEIARQLTLIEHALYKSIKPQECLGQAWTKKATRDEKAPNIMAMIHRFNTVSRWVATEIIKVDNLKKRAEVLDHFIQIATGCEKLNNYNAMMEIISGLQCSSIFRLKQTWALLSKQSTKKYEQIHALMSRERNFQQFREHLHSVDPPCVPYLGVYLTDLTFIEDGNPDYLADGGLINFDKRRKISQVIREIQQYQQTPYCLGEVPSIKEYLLKAEYLGENETYDASLKLEAKGSAPPSKRKDSIVSGSMRIMKKKDKDKKKLKSGTFTKSNSDRDVSNSSGGGGGDSNESSSSSEEPEDWGELEKIPGYRFYAPDSKENLVFDIDVSAMVEGARPTIRAATLEKLIERLTHENWPDPSLVNTFLLTYPTFTNRREVMGLLTMRFGVPRPVNASKEVQDRYQAAKTMPIRLRVFNVVKNWVDRYFTAECASDAEFLAALNRLADRMTAEGMDKAAQALKRAVQRQQEGQTENVERRLLGKPPKPFLPKNLTGEPTLMDYHSEEIARQLCLVEQAMFLSIKPWELLDNAWLAADKNTRAPNVTLITERFTRIRDWVATEILKQDSVEAAASYITQWIKIAEKCLALNNFNSMVEIVSGLQLSDVAKLKNIWMLVTAKNTFNKLTSLMEGNYSKLQDKLHNVQPPCLPYLGAYLNVLLDLDAKHPNHLEGGLINFEKRTLVSGAITEIQQYQQTLYCLEPVPFIQDWMASVEVYSPGMLAERSNQLLSAKKKKEKKKKDDDVLMGVIMGTSPSTEGGNGGGVGGPGSELQRTSSIRANSRKKLGKLFGIDEKILEAENQLYHPPQSPPSATAAAASSSSSGGASSAPSASSTGSPQLPRSSSSPSNSGRVSFSAARNSGGSEPRTSGGRASSSDLGIGGDSQLRFQLLSIFLDDHEFRKNVQEVLLKDVVASLRKELEDFKTSIRTELASSSSIRGGGAGAPSFDVSTVKEIICSKFPGKSVSLWTTRDTDGLVYGWAEDIRIHTVTEGRNVSLAEARQSVDKADVAALLRVARLYASATGRRDPKVFVFAHEAKPEALAAANGNPNIEIQLF